MREEMMEKGVNGPLLHKYYDPASKYTNQFAVADEPLANYMDVSIWLVKGKLSQLWSRWKLDRKSLHYLRKS